MATTNENGNCSKVHLSLHVPHGHTNTMRRLLKPQLKAADPLLNLVHVHESPSPVLRWEQGPVDKRVPEYCVGNQETLTTPALSLITFLPEDEAAEQARERLQAFPWKFHHRIELHNLATGPSSSCVLYGKQEFYSLSRQYPLCCVCPSPSSSSCTVRFNLFVRNYRAMLEFYRLLADSEMESTKADFALFSVNTSNSDFVSFASSFAPVPSPVSVSSSSSHSSTNKMGTRPALTCSVQLALKHCPYLDPYPLSSAYLTFFVRNMTALQTVLPGKAVEMCPNTHLVRDPDGNCVVVHDVNPPFTPLPSHTLTHSPRAAKVKEKAAKGRAKDSVVKAGSTGKGSSCCESQDSGRFSDSERGSSELDQCLERLVREVNLNITDFSESSETDSDQLEVGHIGSSCGGVTGGCCSDPVTGVEHMGCLNHRDSERKVHIGRLSSIQHRKKKIVYF